MTFPGPTAPGPTTPAPAPAPAIPPTTLPLTGERTVPGIVRENYWFRRHEVVYHWIIQEHDLSGTVVEAGCGEGYGADLLRRQGAQVVALDYDEQVVSHVRRSYPQVQPVQANLVDLPLRSTTVDSVVSLQVIEHLWDLGAFWSECRRVLKPGGRLIVSTPNRLTFSPGVARGQKPTNPFHVEEFDADQLVTLLTEAGFTDVRVLGLRHAERLRTGPGGDIVRQQIDASLTDSWPQHLLERIAQVSCADFDIGAVESDTDLDLIVVARR